jgi:hypothetical protein
MGLQIKILIKDQDLIDELTAVGARDLRKTFLPKAGIKAHSVILFEIDDENTEKMNKGLDYKSYSDTSIRQASENK